MWNLFKKKKISSITFTQSQESVLPPQKKDPLTEFYDSIMNTILSDINKVPIDNWKIEEFNENYTNFPSYRFSTKDLDYSIETLISSNTLNR